MSIVLHVLYILQQFLEISQEILQDEDYIRKRYYFKTLLQRSNGIREEKGEGLSTFLPTYDGGSGGTGSRINVREYRRRGPTKENPEKLPTR